MAAEAMPLVTRLCRYERVYFLHAKHEHVSSIGLHLGVGGVGV
jgi:hypothetical protein